VRGMAQLGNRLWKKKFEHQDREGLRKLDLPIEHEHGVQAFTVSELDKR